MIVYNLDLYDQFKCIGSECPDTCCAEWEIKIDQKSDEYYRLIEGEFGIFLNRCIDRSGEVVQMKKIDGRCALLTEQGLCRLQLELGEEALCDTCRLYPRSAYRCDNISVLVLATSCPEVVRLILTRKKPFRLLREVRPSGKLDIETDKALENLHEQTFVKSISILQDHSVGITLRQKYLLLFNQAMQAAMDSQNRGQAKELLNYFSNSQLYHTLETDKESVCDLSSKIRLLREFSVILLRIAAMVRVGTIFVDVLNSILAVCDDPQKLDAVHPYFEQLLSAQYQREQENLLVQGILRHSFNETFGKTLYERIVYTVAMNQLFRIFIAFISMQKGEMLGLDERIRQYCAISRCFEHNASVDRAFSAILRENRLTELPFLFQLIS